MENNAHVGMRLREIRGATPQKVFAERLGVPLRTYIRYENGERNPPSDVLTRAAEIGNTTVDWILSGKDIAREAAQALEEQRIGIVMIPVRAMAGAGTPKDLFEAEPVEYIPVPKDSYRVDMSALVVSGQSMEPVLRDGARALTDPHDLDLIDGKIYVVYIKDNGIVLKRLYRGAGIIILKSDNPATPEITVKPEDIVVQGRVIGVSQEL